MSHTFIIYTEQGKPDSLRQRTEVLITLTPAESKRRTCPYSEVALSSMYFDKNCDDISPIEWSSDLLFSPYVLLTSGLKRTVQLFGTSSEALKPGHAVTMTTSDGKVSWSPQTPYGDIVAFKQSSVMAINSTGSAQNTALCTHVTRSFKRGRIMALSPIAAYHTLEDGGRIISPSDLFLQVYVVADDQALHGVMLRPKDFERPLFAEPLRCATLPAYSTWRLSQDSNGTIHLKNDDQPEIGSTALNARPLNEIRDQLRTLQQSLDENLKRLATVEKSVASMVAGSSGVDRRIPALEAQSQKLTKSFDQTRDYLSSVQNFLQDTRVQVASLDGKVPDIEAKVKKLAESFDENRDNVQNALVDLGSRADSVEEETKRLKLSLEQVRDSVDSGDETSVMFPGRPHDTSLSPARPSNPVFPSLPSF